MSSSMDVDPTPAGEAENMVEFHALAIVHMSDQYTRISCGGSPLDKNDPCVGLLFGTRSNGRAVEIIDADDIPTEVSDATKQQIALHQAVFPQHAVVGWYRVSVDNQPTAQDVQLTKIMKQHFAPDGRFLFSLLQVKSDSEALPLSLYELDSSNGNVLIGTENWQLETSEPERIGVERVVREQTRAKQKDESYSAFGTQVTSIQTSLLAMNERLVVLITYLEKTSKGEIPLNHALLRQVQALVCQLGPIMQKPTLAEENPELLSHMAVVAKTVQAVQSYTDKCRSLHENRGSSMAHHREQRRY